MSNNEKQFVNFKIHSQFSICEGAVKIDELSNYCKNNKVKAVVSVIASICVAL